MDGELFIGTRSFFFERKPKMFSHFTVYALASESNVLLMPRHNEFTHMKRNKKKYSRKLIDSATICISTTRCKLNKSNLKQNICITHSYCNLFRQTFHGTDSIQFRNFLLLPYTNNKVSVTCNDIR